MTMAALSGSRYIEYLLRPMRDSTDVTQSDLGTEEDLEMLLNTFSGYDMEIADLSQHGANAERARTTSCLTSRSPGPAKPKDARCQESIFNFQFSREQNAREVRGCSARRGGQLHNFRNFRKRNEGDRGTGQGDAVGRLLGSLEDLGKAAAVSGSTPVNNIPVNIRTRR